MSDTTASEPPAADRSATADLVPEPADAAATTSASPEDAPAADGVVGTEGNTSASTAHETRVSEAAAASDEPSVPTVSTSSIVQPTSSSHTSAPVPSEQVSATGAVDSAPTASDPSATPSSPPANRVASVLAASSSSNLPSPSSSAISSPAATTDTKTASAHIPPPAAAAASSSSQSKDDPVSPPPKPRGTPPTTAAMSPSASPSSEPLTSPVKSAAKSSPAPIQSPPLSAAKAPAKSPVTKPAPPRVTPVKTSLPASASASTVATPVATSLPQSTVTSASPPAYPLPSNVQLALLAKTQGQTDAYGNTTRCICHDNSNSDGFMLSCDTCIAEGTPVATRYGLAVPIEAVTERGCEVLAVSEQQAGSMCKSVVERGAVGTNVKGERAVCRMWLADGRYLDLTDDHPVFVRGKRGEAPQSRPVKALKAGGRHALNTGDDEGMEEDEVAMAMMGVDAAVDDCRLENEDERCWNLQLSDSSLPPLSFSPLPLPLPPSPSLRCVVSHRDRALAFARVLGYVLGCGRRRMCSDSASQPVLRVAFQHWLDVDEWVKDVNIVMCHTTHSSSKQTIRAGRCGRWWVALPSQLSAVLSHLTGVHTAGGSAHPPAFVDCAACRPPASFIREYVAALFGALGDPMRCKRQERYADSLHLHPAVTLTAAKHTSTLGSSAVLLAHVSSLLSLLGIKPSEQRTAHQRCSLGPRPRLHVTCPIAFSRLMSFRYAALKQLRLSVGCAYLHYRRNVKQQRLIFPASLAASQTSAFVSQKWSKHVESAMPTLHSSSSPLNPLRLPTFSQFLSAIGLPSLFDGFMLPATATSLPAYYLPVVAVQTLSSPLPVYDLSMQAGCSPSFLASSVAVHNCEVWQHGDCLQVNERSVPEQYFCELCSPFHPIHVHNDSVKKSAINKRIKGKGKAAKLAGLGSPQVESRKSLESKQKKDVKAVWEGKKEAVKGVAAEKDKPKQLGAVVTASAEVAKKKKTKRDDEAAIVGGSEKREGRDQQPATKKARVDDRVTTATGKEKEEKQEKQTSAAAPTDIAAPLASSASAPDLNELGSDGMDAREKKKLKKLLETIQKMEDQNVKKRKKPEGETPAGETKERDDTHVAVAPVQDERAAARAMDEDAAMDTSSPSSPNMSTARSVRAKLRAERDELDAVPGQLLQSDMVVAGGSLAALNASGAALRKKKKTAAGNDSDDDVSDVVDFAFRRRRWQDVRRASGSEMGPFYLGKKEWLLSGWRREKEREATGWDDRVKDEQLGVVKRAIDNWREEKKEKEDELHEKELGTAGTARRRMAVQRAVDGVPTITKYELVAGQSVAESDTNGDRKRKEDEDDGEAEHDRERSPLFSPTTSNGTAHTAPSATAATSSAATASTTAAASRSSIPKISRGMLNGLGSKGGAGSSAPARLSNSRQSSLGAAQH